MPTLDLEPDFSPDAKPADEVVTAFFRAFLPDFYFVNTPISRMRRHLPLIQSLAQTPLRLDFHQPTGAHFTELTLGATDEAMPGLLSKIVGTLAGLKITIHTAWIHTLRDPNHLESGRRVVLDTLILSESALGLARPLSPRTQERVRGALTPILQGGCAAPQLNPRILKRLTPLVIDENSAVLGPENTLQIRLRTGADNVILFRITRVLAGLGLDIAHAQINAQGSSVAGTFFVSKSGGAAIEEVEIPALLEKLRFALENELAP